MTSTAIPMSNPGGWIAPLCGAVGPFTAIAVSMAPIPTIQKVASDKSVGNLPLLPYSSMVVNSLIWVTYGFLIREKKVWLSSSAGVVLGAYYWIVFVNNCPRGASNLPGTPNHHLHITLMILLLTLMAVVWLPVKQSSMLVGAEGVLFCAMLFGSPLAALKQVVETKSAKSIPLPFTVACIVNCFCWTVFGFFEMQDFMIYAPTTLGLFFGLIQLALKLFYGNGNPSTTSEATAKSSSMELPLVPRRGGGGGIFALPI